MRSARMILATAAATAAIAFAAPGAYASGNGEEGRDDSSYNKGRGDDSRRHEPRGGVHTGGGALTALEGRGDKDGSDEPRGGVHTGGGAFAMVEGRGDDSGGDRPRGGMHTGGGALAMTKGHGDEGGGDRPRGGVHTGGGALAMLEGHGDEGGGDRPRGGVHTGGGALASVVRSNWTSDSSGDSSRFDPETYKDNSGKSLNNSNNSNKEKGSDSERNRDSWGEEDRPSGGMHTGGGALATPGVTAGGLAVVAFLGTGVYALRRKHAGGSAS
jgi:hypothetical protein